jgi:glutathione S-transferase
MSTSNSQPIIIGNHLSPFVRKALATCRHKGIDVLVDPIVPFYGNDQFTRLSPMRRVPVLIHGDLQLPDSTVIAEYLDELQPSPSILPGTAADRARSRWLDEFADTRMAQVFIWGLFAKAVVLPGVFGEARDLAAIAKLMHDDVPPIMDVLERHAPRDGFIGGSLGLGDISVATQFANLRWARQVIDPERWPRTSAWVARVEATDALGIETAHGNAIARVPPDRYREVLAAAGVLLTPDTLATQTPRRSATSQL